MTEGARGEDGPGFVAIVGAGQVGTALGIALRSAGAAAGVRSVALFDERPDVVEESLDRGAGDRALRDLGEALEADTLVLAVPVPQIVDLVEGVGPRLRPGSLLIDTGSAKAEVAEAMRRLPESVHAIGGHPLAGTERPGPAGADPARLRGAAFVLTPVRDDPVALRKGDAFARALGAVPVEMSADAHDRVVARTSHLPHVAAFALAAVASRCEGDAAFAAALVGTGFRSATRLAASDPAMVAGFLRSNAPEVRRAVEELRERLSELAAALDDGEAVGSGRTPLLELLRAARAAALELSGGEEERA